MSENKKIPTHIIEKLRAHYENILAIMPGHVYLKDVNGIWIGCNDLQAKDLGLSSWKECIGKTDYDFFSKEQADLLRKNDLAVIESGKNKHVEEPGFIENEEGEIYLSQKVPLRDIDQNIIGILGISFNITEIKKREAQLQYEKKQVEITLENIIAHMPEHVYWKDKNGVLLGCNDLQAKRVGLSSRKDVIGKTAYDMVAQDLPEKERRAQADAINKIDFQIMKTGISQSIEEPFALPNGDTLVFLSKKVPLYDENQNVVGLLGISFDITAEKEAEQRKLEEQESVMRLLSSSMAHELRTPLHSIQLAVTGIENFLPDLLKTYQIAKDAKLDIPHISPMHYKSLSNIAKNTQMETKAASSIIDMLLINTNTLQIDVNKFKTCSIVQCVETALARYPLQEEEISKIHWQKNDFSFHGDELLMTHVIFNLLKNALYYLKAAGKGEIQIWCEKNEKFNLLHFKDTSLGIPPDILPHIFDRFYTRTRHGTGVGLAFCKLVMESFGGGISCQAVQGDYTDFILTFPQQNS